MKNNGIAGPRALPLYGGYATPSEVSGVGAFATLVMVAIVYRCYHWREIEKIVLGTAGYASMIMMIIAMAFLFSYVMSYLYITQSTTQWLVGLHMSKWAFLFWIDVVVIMAGFFLPPVAIVLMVTPVIMPGCWRTASTRYGSGSIRCLSWRPASFTRRSGSISSSSRASRPIFTPRT